jgi:hypothetical protein
MSKKGWVSPERSETGSGDRYEYPHILQKVGVINIINNQMFIFIQNLI